MALQDHARLPVFFNSAYQTEITDIRITTESGQLVIETTEGMAGFSPGSGKVNVAMKVAIPIGGTEAPFQQICAKGEYCTVQIGCGSVSYEGTGKIITTSHGQGVNQAADCDVNWTGELKPFQ